MASGVRRPPTKAELETLIVHAKVSDTWGNDIAGGGCIATLLLFLGCIFARVTGLLRGQEYWYALIGLVVGLVTITRMRASMAPYRNSRKADLKANEIEETEYEATAVIKVKQYEDLGMNYFLQLIDGKVLFLTGQYLYGLERAKKFPCVKFKVIRTLHSKAVLDLQPISSFLKPFAVLPRFTKEQYRTGKVPADGSVLDLKFDSLLPTTEQAKTLGEDS